MIWTILRQSIQLRVSRLLLCTLSITVLPSLALSFTCPVAFKQFQWDTTPPMYVMATVTDPYLDKWFSLRLRNNGKSISEIELSGVVSDSTNESIPLPFHYYLPGISRNKTYATMLPTHLDWSSHYWHLTILQISIVRIQFTDGSIWRPTPEEICGKEGTSVVLERIR
jgi:hypothetical protein